MRNQFEFKQNTILVGSCDYFCLVCHSHLICKKDVISHIEKKSHLKNLSAVHYLHDYDKELVLEIQKRYYCVYCGATITTLPKVVLHCQERDHLHNKGVHTLQRGADNNVVVFDSFLIDEKAWNGLSGGSCVLCQVEVENEETHKTESIHLLNLVRHKIQFEPPANILRVIDNFAFHCLTCNDIFTMSAMSTHFESVEHNRAINEKLNSKINPMTTLNMPTGVNTPDKHKDLCGVNKTSDTNSNQIPNNKGKKYKINLLEYLLIDNSAFHCLTCNDIFTMSAMSPHFESVEHNRALNENPHIKINPVTTPSVTADANTPVKQKDLCGVQKPDTNSSQIPNDIETNNKISILEYLDKFERSGIKINLEHETAFCRNCSHYLDFNYNALSDHIGKHKVSDTAGVYKVSDEMNEIKSKNTVKAPRKLDKNKTDIQELKEYAKQNMITYDEEENEAFCHLCSVTLPLAAPSVRKHVNGAYHTKKYRQKTQLESNTEIPKPRISKIRMQDFIQFITFVDTDDDGGDAIIDNKFCITGISLFLIIKKANRAMCELCKQDLFVADMESHYLSKEHREKFLSTFVVTSLEVDEFVREMPCGTYHCGFCNSIVDSWEELTEHLSTADHKKEKKHASERLAMHLFFLYATQIFSTA